MWCRNVNASDAVSFQIRHSDYRLLYGTDDALWIASGSMGQLTISVSLSSIDINRLQHTIHAEAEKIYHFSASDNQWASQSHCALGRWGSYGLELSFLIVVAFGLYRMDVASWSVPAVGALVLVLMSTGAKITPVVLALLGLGTLLFRAARGQAWPFYVAVPTMDWAYSFLLLSSVVVAICSRMMDRRHVTKYGLASFFIVGMTALVAAILVNHPTYFIVAGLVGLVCPCLAVASILLLDLEAFFVSILLLVVSVCVYVLGRVLRKYRFHIIVHGRRCYSSLRSSNSTRDEMDTEEQEA